MQNLYYAICCLFAIIAIFTFWKSKSKIKKIESSLDGFTFEFAEDNDDSKEKSKKLNTHKSDIKTELQKSYNLSVVTFLLLFFLIILSIAFAPYCADIICKNFGIDKDYSIKVRVSQRTEKGNVIPLKDAIVDLNNNSSDNPTDTDGTVTVKYYKKYNPYPGCPCNADNNLTFTIIDKNGNFLFKQDEKRSDEWFASNGILELVQK
jgi:hypothetical protein